MNTYWKIFVALPLRFALAGAAPQEADEERPGELIGLALYGLPYAANGIDPQRFIDTLAGAGFNHTRIIMPSRCWIEGGRDLPSPFLKVKGRHDLTKYDEGFLGRFEELLDYAAERGVAVQVDMFDEVMLHHWEYWIRSEWWARNNVNGWLGRTRGGSGGLTSRFYETVRGTQPPVALGAQEGYFDAIAARVRPPHLIGDGNELLDAEFSLHFLERFGGANKLVCGHRDLWNTDDASTDKAKQERLLGDPAFEKIFRRVDYIAVHSVEPSTIERRYRFVEPVLRRHPQLRVIFSTDGAGLGSRERRPLGERPSAEDIREVIERGRLLAGERFGGVEVKLLGYADFLELVERLGGVEIRRP